jgi:hypothetical protein
LERCYGGGGQVVFSFVRVAPPIFPQMDSSGQRKTGTILIVLSAAGSIDPTYFGGSYLLFFPPIFGSTRFNYAPLALAIIVINLII